MKNIIFRNFSGGYGISADYLKLHDFLVENNNYDFTYGRLDWMITHRPYLEEQFLNRIGIWEDNGKIVATTLFDTSLDDIYPIVQNGYEFLYPQMIEQALAGMTNEDNPSFRLFINENDGLLKQAALEAGLMKTEDSNTVLLYDLTQPVLLPTLPNNFSFVSLNEEKEYQKYLYCLFQGFDHEKDGEIFKFDNAELEEAKNAYERIYVDLNLKTSIKAPTGEYVAHCGMWYDTKSSSALIEPVCTTPKYRHQNLGKAVVLAGLKKVQELGAKYAVVGSNQQFYYSIGMTLCSLGFFWTK